MPCVSRLGIMIGSIPLVAGLNIVIGYSPQPISPTSRQSSAITGALQSVILMEPMAIAAVGAGRVL